ENKPSKTYSAIDLFRIPAIRFVTVKITYIWFTNSFVFYGLTLNTGALAGDIFLNNLFVGIVSLLSYLV
uniref:Uncharacterized protein n=3 Tax=Ciona intestinalis TaxID=7719 RepID=H2Y324_CIOIN